MTAGVIVALRKESVDRNGFRLRRTYLDTVALRKESVDRNILMMILSVKMSLSLSARRAGIEIFND